MWPVGKSRRDDRARFGNQGLWTSTQVGMFGHIIHLAVSAERQPAQEFRRGSRYVGAGNADSGKAQFLSPDFNSFDERVGVPGSPMAWVTRIGVSDLHSPHDNPVDRFDPSLPELVLDLPGEVSTISLGREMAPLLTPGMVVWLDGDLGAGKTTLVRAFLRGLGYEGPVKSPTYTLVEVYVVSSIYWYHFDFYRFSDPEEFADAGLGEYFRSDSVCLVEWPGNAAGFVPSADLVLRFQFVEKTGKDAPESGRRLGLQPRTEVGLQCLTELKSRWQGAVG